MCRKAKANCDPRFGSPWWQAPLAQDPDKLKEAHWRDVQQWRLRADRLSPWSGPGSVGGPGAQGRASASPGGRTGAPTSGRPVGSLRDC